MFRIFKKYIVLFILIIGVYNTYSYAATITVTNLNDAGSGSLRQAIITANLDAVIDEIIFTTNLNGTITLASNLPTITNSLIITGLGVDKLTVSGAGLYTMFIVTSGKVLTISKFNFTNNSTFNGSIFRADDSGSSIVASDIKVTSATKSFAFYTNNPSTISVSNSTFTSNSGILFGSDFGSTPSNTSNDDADYSNRIKVINSTFSNNTGMIFKTERYVKIDGCTFANNTSGIGNFRGLNRYQVLNSTFTGNGSTLFIFYSTLATGTFLSTLGTNHHLFNANTFSNNKDTVINTGTANEQSKTTISNNTFLNNGTKWTGNPAVLSNNTYQSAATLSNFNDVTKIYFDGSYTISPPNTNSSGAFTYTSSNTAVATISGAMVTIIGAGETTINASQAADANYAPSSISSKLTVNSVSVVTENGKVSSTNVDYVNKSGAIGGNYGVNENGKSNQTKSSDIITAGLVMHLDAGNVTSYPGTGTLWTDLSSFGNNGTLVSGPTYNSANGGNIVFNGSNYVSAPLTKTASGTFSVWAKSISANSNNMLFNAGNNGAGPDLFFGGGVLSWNTWDSSNNPFGKIPTTAANGNWHNYVVVNDAVPNTAKLYYDGVLYGTAGYRNASATTTLYIGGNNGGYQWNGAIGNFQVHNRVLSPAEIVQNFNNLKARYGL